MTDSPTLLRFRSESEYRTAIAVLAGDAWRHEDTARLMADLREVSRPTGAFTVAIGAAVDAVRAERAMSGGSRPRPPAKRGYNHATGTSFWLRDQAPRTPRHRKGDT